ncbi:MAG: rRNA pseudouridine synthase [Selenomonadaceae bacterium]|nr:rRNA pseudouridine synthase [Selenomonadaceae bacterium]
MSEERLQKILSRAGISSRRAAEKIILEGRVTVDDKIISELGAKADTEKNKICVDGKILKFDEEKIYILLNKPKNFLCTVKDDRGRKTVLDLVKNISDRIYPVGRLDFDSEGLIILTNDGELTNLLLHPKFKINKTYRAKIFGELTDEKIKKLRAGIELDDGLTAPAEVFVISREKNFSVVEITIHEGRNRQIRRMFAAVGCEVKKLIRIKFANLTLKGVESGKFRRLTEKEIKNLYSQVLGIRG